MPTLGTGGEGQHRTDDPRAPDIEARVIDALGRSRLAGSRGAYTAILGERALEMSGRGGRPAGPLERATFAVKDMIAIRGQRRGAGSRTREQTDVCGYDAQVVATMLRAGAVLVGLTALHELAFGVTGINAYTGTPANPAGEGRIPGGSSSGSAVAVATGSADVALGTDTGGSIRIPAALCGVVGYKPARARFPTAGVLPLAPTLDHVGVLTGSVSLAATVDRLFGSATATPADMGPPVGRRTFGVHRAHLVDCEPAVRDAIAAAVDRLARDHSIVDVVLPSTEEVLGVTNTIMFFEAAQIYGVEARDPDSGLGDDVRARLEAGLAITLDDYERARARAVVLTHDVQAAMGALDAIVEPTVPMCAPVLADAPDLGPRLVAHTRLANMTGLPAISLPVPTDGLPIGLQLTGARSADLLLCAAVVEESLRPLSPPRGGDQLRSSANP